MSAAWTWVWLDLRRRRRSLAVLALLVALTTAVVLTAAAGSRRGATAVDRLLDETKPATLAVLPNEVGFDWDEVRAIDGVEAVGLFPLSSYLVDGRPSDQFAYDAAVMYEIEAPIVLEGRLPDPSRDDEAVVTAAYEQTYGKGVGDHATIELYSPAQTDEIQLSSVPPEDAEGPAIDAEIVGVVRSGWFSDYGDTTSGMLIPSPAVFEQHRANLLGEQGLVWVNALVRLADGGQGVGAFRDELARVSGRSDIEFFTLSEDAQHVRDVTGFEADALLAFAAAAAIASVFLVGQSVIRYVAGATPELEVLRAVGIAPRRVRWMAAAGPGIAGVVGAVVGSVAAWFASSRFPMGTAEAFEPAPGRAFHAGFLVLGAGLGGAVVAGGALWAAWIAARSLGRVAPTRTSRLADLAPRIGASVPASIGARFALERGSGSQAVPVLPAIVGAVVGVLGIVGALTFADGIDDATSHPERFGVFAQMEAFFGFNGQDEIPADVLTAAIASAPDVVAVNDNRTGVAEAGEVDMTLFTVDTVDHAPLPLSVIDGRLPERPGEVALAPTTADAMGAKVGDEVELTSQSTETFEVSGLAFVPEGPHNQYHEGAWVTADGYDDLTDTFKFHWVDVTIREGADVGAAATRINEAVATALEAPPGTEIVTLREPPAQLGELRRLGRLPAYLAAFLGLLAVTAVGHAVASAVRRRRLDLAVLRAIGLTRWQTRAVALTQATVLAAIGLVIGVPLGVATGRSIWRAVADSTPVIHVAPVALLALLLIAPVTLLLANALAAWPSQRAASLRVGHVLRTE